MSRGINWMPGKGQQKTELSNPGGPAFSLSSPSQAQSRPLLLYPVVGAHVSSTVAYPPSSLLPGLPPPAPSMVASSTVADIAQSFWY